MPLKLIEPTQPGIAVTRSFGAPVLLWTAMRDPARFAVTVKNVLIGHDEHKAPSKGADPRLFIDEHDREKLRHSLSTRS